MEGFCGVVLYLERFLVLQIEFPGDKGSALALPPAFDQLPALLQRRRLHGHRGWLLELRAAVSIQFSCYRLHLSGDCRVLLNYT